MTREAPFIATAGRVYFSIDGEDKSYIRADFNRRLISHSLHDVRDTVGCYDGETEHSWSCDVDDWNRVVRFDEALEGQESFLHVAADTAVATLIFNATGERYELGTWTEVDEATAKREMGWTYYPETGVYFTTF